MFITHVSTLWTATESPLAEIWTAFNIILPYVPQRSCIRPPVWGASRRLKHVEFS